MPERDIHKPRRAAASLPFRGGKPLRRRRADEGIGPYKVQRKIEGCGRTESSAPTNAAKDVCERGINRGENGQNFHRMTVEGCV